MDHRGLVDEKQKPKRSAPADQSGSQTVEEHGSHSPNRTDTPGVYGNLFGEKDGSRVPKSDNKLKATHQDKR